MLVLLIMLFFFLFDVKDHKIKYSSCQESVYFVTKLVVYFNSILSQPY
jgi:hypothetical protein